LFIVDFETWWLIFIPLVFALGWIAARVDIRQMLSETRTLPKSYFKGLNFLLNEQPDRAIDAFVEVAKLDPETTELHFALGSLFRRRGEMERAIRVHQSLLSRADLPLADRESAQHELAQDFLKAGMLDRAEHAFELVLDTRFAVPAVRALIRIYESEHDWDRAIDAVKRLRALVDEPVPQLVHYQCERAVAALSASTPDIQRAEAALDAAENAATMLEHGDHAQASRTRLAMLRAQVARLQGSFETERAWLESVLSIAPDYAGLVANELVNCYRRLDRADQGLNLLLSHYQQHPTLDVFNVVFRELRLQQGYQPAWGFARQALRVRPSLLGLDRLIEAELASREQGGQAGSPALLTDTTDSADLVLLRSLIHKHTQRLDRYACRVCGFEARHFYWQCPGCNSWETYQPRRLEEIK
jgi:lipopolysaccharide biosynthesis regulator YciM